MRSAGCVINDYADRDFDAHVKRTANRPIATGKITPRQALIFFAVLCLLAFILVLFTNQLTILLSFGAALWRGFAGGAADLFAGARLQRYRICGRCGGCLPEHSMIRP